MQTKKSQPLGQRIMLETLTSFLALSVHPWVRISLSALGTDNRFYLSLLPSLIWISDELHILSTKIYLAILIYPITLQGCFGTKDDYLTIPFHFVLFSDDKVRAPDKKKKVKVAHSQITVGAVGVRVPLYLGHS